MDERSEILLGFDVGGTKCAAVLGRRTGDDLEIADKEVFATADFPEPARCIGRYVEAMREAAKRFVGEHDFAPFAANPHRELSTTVMNVFDFRVKQNGPRIVLIVRGDGFLYKQVRSMAGFLLKVGTGNEKPEAVTEILEARAPRTARVETAPSKGLFLWKVWYK